MPTLGKHGVFVQTTSPWQSLDMTQRNAITLLNVNQQQLLLAAVRAEHAALRKGIILTEAEPCCWIFSVRDDSAGARTRLAARPLHICRVPLRVLRRPISFLQVTS